MVENIHFQSVLAFLLAHGGKFIAQEHLLTPSERRDTALQSRSGGQIPTDSMKSHCMKHRDFTYLAVLVDFGEVYLPAQMEFEGVL